MKPGEDLHYRVLVLAPAGRDAPLTQAVLVQAGISASICAHLPSLCDELMAAAAALITEEALVEWDVEPLVHWIGSQERWSDFPFVIMLDRGARAQTRKDIAFLRSTANITLLERPISTGTLVSTVKAALRARRRQYEVRDTLDALARSEQRYRALADDLERQVVLRTERLAQANERLRNEIAERERAEDALRQAQKLESLGQLTSGVAHDFNNLLQAVVGNIEMAEARIADPAARHSLGRATQSAERGAKLTAQLLAFSRKQHLAPKPVDVNALVSGAGDMLFRTMGTSIRIETVLEAGAWPALVDPTQIEMVILNLALNGRDAMANGGRLTLSTANVASASRPAELAAGDYVMIAVTDTGTGMSDAVLAKAFEPFYTTKDVGKGSGLGLSMVHGVAKQSGGCVTIESRLGVGTTVRVYLPRASMAPTSLNAPHLSPPRAASDRVVLVIDDDPAVREVTVQSLQCLGYQTLEAQDGASALEMLDRGARADLLVVDVAMPGMTGIEVVRRARERRPGLRALFVTGYAALHRGEAFNGELLIEKPYTVHRLATAVTTALERPSPPRAEDNIVTLTPSSRTKS